MAIANSKQSWQVGQVVNVGFLKGLVVEAFEATPGDYAPDAYILRAATGRRYRFVPHNGIERMD